MRVHVTHRSAKDNLCAHHLLYIYIWVFYRKIRTTDDVLQFYKISSEPIFTSSLTLVWTKSMYELSRVGKPLSYDVSFILHIRLAHHVLTLWWRCISLQWRQNDHDGVSNHQPHGCLLNRLFRRRSTKTSKLRVTGLCAGNSPGPVNSPHKGPVTRKCFHLMTSSCSTFLNSYPPDNITAKLQTTI